MSSSQSLEAHAHAVQDRLTDQSTSAQPADSSDRPSQSATSASREPAQAQDAQDSARPTPEDFFTEPLPSDAALAVLRAKDDTTCEAAASTPQASREASGQESTAASPSQEGFFESAEQDDVTGSASKADVESEDAQLESSQRQNSLPQQSTSLPQRQDSAQDGGKQGMGSNLAATRPASYELQQQPEPSSSSSVLPPQPMSASASTGSDRPLSRLTTPPPTGADDSKGRSASAQDGSASDAEPSTATDADQVLESGTKDNSLSSQAEKLHDLIAASSSTDDEVPDALKTFDSNLPDEPEPDETQQGPRLFQSAPKLDTSLPTSQGPRDPEKSPPKQDTAAQELESQPLRPVSEGTASNPDDNTAISSDQPESTEPVARQPLAELEPAVLSERDAASSQAGKASAKDPEEGSAASGLQAPGTTPSQKEEAGEEAAQLRQHLQQLQQAMADKQAALAAAEASCQSSQELQQQQPGKEQSNAQLNDKRQQSRLAGQQQKPEEPQKAENANPARVLPLPSASGDVATIFVERPVADDKLQSYPVDLDQFEQEGEDGIDLVALAAGE